MTVKKRQTYYEINAGKCMGQFNLKNAKTTSVSTSIAAFTAVLLVSLFFGGAKAQQLPHSDPYRNSIAIASEANVDEDVLSRHVVALGAADLTNIADIWQRRVQTNLSKIAEGLTQLETAVDHQAPELVNQIKTINRQNIGDFQNYLITVNALERKGGSKEELEKHQGFIRGFVTELLLSYQWSVIAQLSKDWVLSGRGGFRALSGVFQAIMVLTVAFLLGGVLKRISSRRLHRRRNENEIAAVVIPNVIRWSILVLGFFVALWGLDVNLGITTAIFGGLGFLVVFMLQNFFQSVIGGLLLQATNPYSKGDTVSINHTIGTVVDVNVISTKLRTFDNRLVQIPNQSIWQGSMENLTKYRVRRVDLVFGIGYTDDIERAKATLAEMVGADKRCLRSPETRIFVGELGPSSVNVYCRPWVRTDDYWDVMWDLTEIGKTRLQNEGISIAFPQMDVHVHTKKSASSEVWPS
ncbi:mechanosensitive ion channel family protein [Ruegeria atlantica]|uniref:Small-conductance mechanosensitive channel n=2 Tax=Ruegeria TaxID=97050 RepID=A0A0N7LQR4_9RHOB|nr:mechanosensitive ion channel family protein [Ruegeria atlantica]CUH48748.1 Small-conductance mechanosensitive channel [Ruegeria atlantica]